MTEWVSIARLLRTRGRRGELSALALTSHRERFAGLEEVTLFGGEGFPRQRRRFAIEEIWEHGDRLIIKFAGVDGIGEAEALRGAEVQVPQDERFALPEGEYYHSDLIGCRVFDRRGGREIGVVEDFLDAGGNGLLRVMDGRGREVLIPFRKQICVSIDLAAKRIEIDPPDGLVELND